MKLKTLATATCMSLATATASFAVPVDFEFSFTNGTNTISGLIEGLDSDGLGQSATSVTADGISDTFVFTVFSSNVFDVSGGVIDLTTLSLLSDSGIGQNTLGFAEFGFVDGSASYVEFPESGVPAFDFVEAELSDVQFTAVSTVVIPGPDPIPGADPAPSLVPLPAAGLLMLSGLAGFAGLKRRKKRAA